MCQMEIAYCFHSIAADCWDADEVETVTYRCPSSSWSAEDCSADLVRKNLFDSCHLKAAESFSFKAQNVKRPELPGIDDPPGVWGLEGIGKLFICEFADDVGVF